MKKYYVLSCLLIITIVLVSWGFKGHQAVATIAENHLTPNAKGAVQALLGNQTMADVASWADEVRNQPEYKETGPWHYIDLELGMNYEQFSAAVKEQGAHNVYGALLKYEDNLRSAATSPEQRAIALKFIIHFIGDAHQPMHVSRAEDKGGNSIQVQFNGRGTNLHSLWDSGLINKQGMTFNQMAKDYDTATSSQIKKWQSDSPMQWLWESYQISTRLYAEVDKGSKLDDDYYNKHISIVQERIEQGGIRLAGVLNDIFKNGTATAKTVIDQPMIDPTPLPSPALIDVKDAASNIGNTVSIKGKVYGYKEVGGMTLVNIGAAFPDQLLTVVLKKDVKDMGKNMDGKTVVVTGKLIEYKDKPEVIITESSKIQIAQ